MTSRNGSMILVTAGCLALLLNGATSAAIAQTPPPPTGAARARQHDMMSPQGLPGGSHHVEAMAYRDTLATLARALGTQVRGATTVNPDLLRPQVAEIRRRLGQIQEHHQLQMTMMGDQAKTSRMEHFETRLAELGEDVEELESEVSVGTARPKKVAARANEILRHCAALSAKPVNARPRVVRKTP